jgi:hypothetical protein
MTDTLADIIARDKERLGKEREAIFTQQQELEQKLEEINREMRAIDAYEATKSGKHSEPRQQRKPQGIRRTGIRDDVLKVVSDNPDGLTRDDVLVKMHVKGDKSATASVSQALSALSKAKQLTKDGRTYRAA